MQPTLHHNREFVCVPVKGVRPHTGHCGCQRSVAIDDSVRGGVCGNGLSRGRVVGVEEDPRRVPLVRDLKAQSSRIRQGNVEAVGSFPDVYIKGVSTITVSARRVDEVAVQ